MKAWSGRFSGTTEPVMERFSSSIRVDWRLFRYDIEGSIAYAEMLARIGILSRDENVLIIGALREIEAEIENGELEFRDDLEDIHMHVEHRLIEKIGELGKKLHTGRSRNEQVSLDTRMYAKEELARLDSLLKTFLEAVLTKAEAEKSAIMAGYTHTRRAQVVPFAHYLLSYYYTFKRDRERISEARSRMDAMPLGSGALAGSTLPIDREFLRERLGFSRISENSMDAASDRDFVLDTLYCTSMIMIHLSKLSEDLILFSTEEYSFLDLPDGLCTGSSLMPHKKNPDALELIRGKASRSIGGLFGMFSLMKGLPSTYNRDLQEDKEPLFQGIATAQDALEVMTLAVQGLSINKDNMERAVTRSFMPAVEMAEYLSAKGVPFREAHHIVGAMVKACEGEKKYLWQMSPDEMQNYSDVFDNTVFDYINPHNVVNNRKTPGGASFAEVEKQIKNEKAYLGL
ncbi:MAG: Argininosuccinate lyase [Syntrophorhabdaceae bacterium PtaU1.Bin034]|jgi:argininosuccinate lyase|nr:MAG: Argininosuccinate lyase [Syntrophorhabdaceae bacterium PtaU1.Bin034]